MVLCQRFAYRACSRDIFIASQQGDETTIVPVRGAWEQEVVDAGLGLPDKNPMSVVMDQEKFIVCYLSFYISVSSDPVVRVFRWDYRDRAFLNTCDS